MQRARKWLRNTVFRRAKIPPLPDEILVNIFEFLTPEDRLPLRLVSKKFRDLELTIGNRTFGIVHFLVTDDDPESFLLNGPLMLTMLRIAPEVQFDCIHCTTQDILTAFQVICESRSHKYAILMVVGTAIDNLLSLAEQQGFLVAANCVIDYISEYIMEVVNYSEYAHEGCVQIVIRRIQRAA